MAFISEAVLAATRAVRPDVEVTQIPRMTWQEAQDRFGSDKPDLRFGMELTDLTEVFAETGFRAFQPPAAVKGILVSGQGDLGRPPVNEGGFRFLWVTEFPLFEGTDASGDLIPAHHPFTMPHPDDLDRLETDPLSIRSQAYDLVLNGWELGSGSIRIHRSDVQQRIFSLLGIDEARAQARFGFLLDAFRHGAPPHGGFAFGIDRLTALLAGEENIREVIAFP